jgi:pyruvate dehydrogenase complex dehydrogenase (E1) component
MSGFQQRLVCRSLLCVHPVVSGQEADVKDVVASMTDEELFGVMTNLGGHDMATLLEAFAHIRHSDHPTAIIAYTLKVRNRASLCRPRSRRLWAS